MIQNFFLLFLTKNLFEAFGMNSENFVDFHQILMSHCNNISLKKMNQLKNPLIIEYAFAFTSIQVLDGFSNKPRQDCTFIRFQC